MGDRDKVLLLAPRTPDLAAVCSLQQIINCHVEDYGVLETTGAPVQPPLIPLCRLVHMEYVQSVLKVSEAVKSLKERFEMEGYCQSIGAKFYVQARDANDAELFVTKDIKNG
jgi:putative NIF3 family GTP cyclohydrolase 1 type 2